MSSHKNSLRHSRRSLASAASYCSTDHVRWRSRSRLPRIGNGGSPHLPYFTRLDHHFNINYNTLPTRTVECPSQISANSTLRCRTCMIRESACIERNYDGLSQPPLTSTSLQLITYTYPTDPLLSVSSRKLQTEYHAHNHSYHGSRLAECRYHPS